MWSKYLPISKYHHSYNLEIHYLPALPDSLIFYDSDNSNSTASASS